MQSDETNRRRKKRMTLRDWAVLGGKLPWNDGAALAQAAQHIIAGSQRGILDGAGGGSRRPDSPAGNQVDPAQLALLGKMGRVGVPEPPADSEMAHELKGSTAGGRGNPMMSPNREKGGLAGRMLQTALDLRAVADRQRALLRGRRGNDPFGHPLGSLVDPMHSDESSFVGTGGLTKRPHMPGPRPNTFFRRPPVDPFGRGHSSAWDELERLVRKKRRERGHASPDLMAPILRPPRASQSGKRGEQQIRERIEWLLAQSGLPIPGTRPNRDDPWDPGRPGRQDWIPRLPRYPEDLTPRLPRYPFHPRWPAFDTGPHLPERPADSPYRVSPILTGLFPSAEDSLLGLHPLTRHVLQGKRSRMK